MHCTLVSCELLKNDSLNTAILQIKQEDLTRRFMLFPSGNFAGVFGTERVFVSSDYNCYGYIPLQELDIGPNGPLEPTRVFDGVPCGEGKVCTEVQFENKVSPFDRMWDGLQAATRQKDLLYF